MGHPVIPVKQTYKQITLVYRGKDTSEEIIKGISSYPCQTGLQCHQIKTDHGLLPKRKFTYFQKNLRLTLTFSASFLTKLFLV